MCFFMKEGAKLSTFYLFRIALESIAYPSCPEIYLWPMLSLMVKAKNRFLKISIIEYMIIDNCLTDIGFLSLVFPCQPL